MAHGINGHFLPMRFILSLGLVPSHFMCMDRQGKELCISHSDMSPELPEHCEEYEDEIKVEANRRGMGRRGCVCERIEEFQSRHPAHGPCICLRQKNDTTNHESFTRLPTSCLHHKSLSLLNPNHHMDHQSLRQFEAC